MNIFNGHSGEFSAKLNRLERDVATVIVEKQLRSPQAESGPWLLLPMLKRDSLDWVIEKATELGVEYIQPLKLARTRSGEFRHARLVAISRAAAEQCGRLTLPSIRQPCKLDSLLVTWDSQCSILVGHAAGEPATSALAGLNPAYVALLTGPEGGFSPEEEHHLLALPFIRLVTFGPRILRAETASIAALVVFQTLIGEAS